MLPLSCIACSLIVDATDDEASADEWPTTTDWPETDTDDGSPCVEHANLPPVLRYTVDGVEKTAQRLKAKQAKAAGG